VTSARWVLLAIAGAVLVAHSLVYNFVTDDAFISFVYSRNFAEHGELSFDLGHPVEGYTNFSWTLLLGALMVVGVPPELASRVLGTACALATLFVVFRMMERAFSRPTPWAALPALVLALSSGFACWTSGGLETQAFVLACVVALDAVVAAEASPRALRRAGVALAIAAMTRPEGLLVAAVLGGVRVVANLVARRRPIGRDELVAAAWLVAIWAPWFAWRWWYYGWPFPNTYYVKASGPWRSPELADQMRDAGLYYVWTWLQQTKLVVALPLAAIGIVWVRPRREPARFVLALACAALAIAYLAYAVSVGGDFMGLHRFIMPVFVAAAIAVVLGVERLVAHAPRELRAYYAIAAPAMIVAWFAWSQIELTSTSTRSCAAPQHCDNDRGIDVPAWLMIYTSDRAKIGRALAPCVRDDDFAILGGAGAQPYYARLRGIDVYGLVSERIAHEEPRINARPGHTKWGNDDLLAAYDPTFVMHCYRIHVRPEPPPLPCNVAFWLARGYEPVTLHVPDLEEMGTYYTFLAKKARRFECPARVR
jgi:hypothetical protein